eukprot:m.312171 g.312171  ORF g.312171 m.312171 type:complete len:296 (+) comp19657_c1_seq7:584-1471(+)
MRVHTHTHTQAHTHTHTHKFFTETVAATSMLTTRDPRSACQIRAFVADLRTKFLRGDFPFIWVQLSPWVGHEAATTTYQLPALRSSQLAVNALPNVGFSTAVDLGDFDPSTNPWGGVHFRNKAPIGPRLANVAAALVYGQTDVKHQSPTAVSAAAVAGGGARVTFVSVQGSLQLRDGNVCPASVDVSKCGWFEIQVAGKWVNATATVDGSSIVVAPKDAAGARFDTSTDATAVRYAWADWPVATLYDDTLPAIPFWVLHFGFWPLVRLVDGSARPASSNPFLAALLMCLNRSGPK